MMKSFNIQDEFVGLAISSVLVSVILTNQPFTGCFAMYPRSMGIVGISGFSLLYSMLGSSSLPGTMLTIISAILLVFAVLLAISADGYQPITNKQGEEDKHEI